MFRKIILIIGLIMVTAGLFLVFTRKDSNDENSVAMYGRFTDDHYISEYLGLDIDMSDSWVYFTEKTLGDNAKSLKEDYGIDLTQMSDEGFFLMLMKPGMVVVFSDNEEQYDASDFSQDYLDDEAEFICSAFNAQGGMGAASLKDVGTITGSSMQIGSYTICLSNVNGKKQNCVFAFFNTDKTGILSMCVYLDDTDCEPYKQMLRRGIKVIDYDDEVQI